MKLTLMQIRSLQLETSARITGEAVGLETPMNKCSYSLGPRCEPSGSAKLARKLGMEKVLQHH